jgi:ABC-type multidrug transport system fused ATPase/permease subunit
MPSKITQEEENRYLFFDRLFGFRKRMKPLEIDFEKPWWQIFTKQKWLVFINLFNSTLVNSINTILPFILAFVLEKGGVVNFFYLFLGLIFWLIINYFLFYFDPFLRNQISSGIVSSASVKLLTTDPINHMTKASGEIISKVNRGGDAGANITGNYLHDVSGFLVTFLSTTLVFLGYGWKYGLIALITFILVSLIIVWGTFSRVKFFTKIKNTFEDKSKQIQLETLTQASYIRSSFSTIEQVNKLKNVIFEDMIIGSNRWRAGNLVQSLARCLYFCGFFILGVLVMQDNNLSTLIKLGFLATYLRTSQTIFNAGSLTNSITQNTHSLVELFNFVKNFGKQSFPVLEKLEVNLELENKIKNSNLFSIKFTDLHFDYGQKAKLFWV